MNGELFKSETPPEESRDKPLAYRMRPKTLEDFAGQEHLLARDKPLYKLITADKLTSCIFYGPPGCGKTALAFLIASLTKKTFVSLNAITSAVADIRKIIEDARWKKNRTGTRTVLFVDEISHFNKLQQDALLPEVENGTLILIGATVQNPFFFINRALVSRSLVFEFRALLPGNLESILKRALIDKENGLGRLKITVEPGAMEHFVKFSEGDGRRALNSLETAVMSSTPDKEGTIVIGRNTAAEATQDKYVGYDREDQHYDTISAFIKSIRGSDPDAAVYWLAKMLAAGENPRFIARRILIAASEDVGNADPLAILVAVSAFEAVELVGMPEAQLNLAQAVVYLATAPKSNASYRALMNAQDALKKEPVQKVPAHLRQAGYSGAETLGSGKGYVYPPEFKDSAVKQQYLEKAKQFYFPADSGYEKKIKDFLRHMENLKQGKEKRPETNL